MSRCIQELANVQFAACAGGVKQMTQRCRGVASPENVEVRLLKCGEGASRSVRFRSYSDASPFNRVPEKSGGTLSCFLSRDICFIVMCVSSRTTLDRVASDSTTLSSDRCCRNWRSAPAYVFPGSSNYPVEYAVKRLFRCFTTAQLPLAPTRVKPVTPIPMKK